MITINHNKNKFPCWGIVLDYPEGEEWSCVYPHSINVDCEHCLCNGGLQNPKTGNLNDWFTGFLIKLPFKIKFKERPIPETSAEKWRRIFYK